MPFIKGESGNPHGRPKTGESIAEYVREFLETNDNEKRNAIITRAYEAAVSKEVEEVDAERWARFLFNRAYGQPKEVIEGSIETNANGLISVAVATAKATEAELQKAIDELK